MGGSSMGRGSPLGPRSYVALKASAISRTSASQSSPTASARSALRLRMGSGVARVASRKVV